MREQVTYDEDGTPSVWVETDGRWQQPPLMSYTPEEYQERLRRRARAGRRDWSYIVPGVLVGVLAGVLSSNSGVGLFVAIIATIAIAGAAERADR